VERKPTSWIDVIGVLLAGWLMFGGGFALPFVNVDPPPFAATKLCVLVVEESTARGSYTTGQVDAMVGVDGPASIRGYVNSKQGEYLLLDKDNPPTKDSPAWVADAWKAAQPNQLPWIVAATPKAGFTRQLPKESAETLADLKKIGGP
jgi:hypothetical protein